MKKLIKYTLVGIAALGLYGCEDQLDRYPKDKLTPDKFFRNEQECQLYTNDFYTIFPTTVYGESADVIAKNVLTSEVLGNRTVPATASTWKWEKLRDINFFLEYSSNCKDRDVRLQYEGLARFFRAYFYFEKVKYYGDVPWVDRPLASNEEELYKGRDSRDLVMSKVIEDLDFAIEHLSPTKETYRVSEWTALALKSRVCLFEGTFRKYHGLDDADYYLAECVSAAGTFIEKSGYTIYKSGSTPYLNLFSSINAISSEIILARAFNTAIGLKHDVNGYLTGTTMGRPGLLKNVANMYLMKDGTPFTSQPGWETMQLPDESKNRDGRFAQTVRTPGYKRIDDDKESAPNLAATMTGYQLVKFLLPAKYDAYQASTSDMPLFRTAEVYLNYAEAKAELGTLTQEDLDKTIKPLRERAGVANLSLEWANANPDPYLASAETGYANVTGANKGVILEIRRERTIELIAEGHRYYDMVRWKEGKMFEQEFKGMYFTPGMNSDGYRIYDLDGSGDVSALDVCLYTTSSAPKAADHPELAVIKTFLKIGSAFELTGATGGNIIVHNTETEPREWREDRDYLYPLPLSQIQFAPDKIKQNPNW